MIITPKFTKITPVFIQRTSLLLAHLKEANPMKNWKKRCLPEGVRATILITAILATAGCGAGGGGAANLLVVTPPPTADTVTTYDITVSEDSFITGSAKTVAATITHNVTQSTIAVAMTLNGITADSAGLRRGFAGDAGSEIYPLTAGSSSSEWVLDASAITDSDESLLQAGGIHLLVTTAGEREGAVRGQAVLNGMTIETFDTTPVLVVGRSVATNWQRGVLLAY